MNKSFVILLESMRQTHENHKWNIQSKHKLMLILWEFLEGSTSFDPLIDMSQRQCQSKSPSNGFYLHRKFAADALRSNWNTEKILSLKVKLYDINNCATLTTVVLLFLIHVNNAIWMNPQRPLRQLWIENHLSSRLKLPHHSINLNIKSHGNSKAIKVPQLTQIRIQKSCIYKQTAFYLMNRKKSGKSIDNIDIKHYKQ